MNLSETLSETISETSTDLLSDSTSSGPSLVPSLHLLTNDPVAYHHQQSVETLEEHQPSSQQFENEPEIIVNLEGNDNDYNQLVVEEEITDEIEVEQEGKDNERNE